MLQFRRPPAATMPFVSRHLQNTHWDTTTHPHTKLHQDCTQVHTTWGHNVWSAGATVLKGHPGEHPSGANKGRATTRPLAHARTRRARGHARAPTRVRRAHGHAYAPNCAPRPRARACAHGHARATPRATHRCTQGAQPGGAPSGVPHTPFLLWTGTPQVMPACVHKMQIMCLSVLP